MTLADSDAPVVPITPDTRDLRPIPLTGGEREVLDAWLEMYRDTVFVKLAGLSAAQLALRSVPPSTMSPIGLVRHLSEVERYWLSDVALGLDTPDLYSCAEDPDGDFTGASAETAAADLATYRAELATAREHQGRITDLDSPVVGLRRGQPVNLRWILTHLIEEYARHLGHLDLLRETIDGEVGY